MLKLKKEEMNDENDSCVNHSESFEKKLRNLKQELKCWESMFFRSHGRKPGKGDIDESGNEIRATYKEYFHLRSRLNGTPENKVGPSIKNENQPVANSNEAKQKSAEKPHPKESSDGVFGAVLNKSQKEKDKNLSSHLKERKIAKNSFTKRRHLRPLDEDKTDNRNDNKVAKEPQEVKSESSIQNSFDVPEEAVLADVKIISSDAKRQSLSSRKSTNVSGKKTSVLSRNYNVSSTWLDKYNPKMEEIPSELSSAELTSNAAHQTNPLDNVKESKEPNIDASDTAENFLLAEKKLQASVYKTNANHIPQIRNDFQKTESHTLREVTTNFETTDLKSKNGIDFSEKADFPKKETNCSEQQLVEKSLVISQSTEVDLSNNVINSSKPDQSIATVKERPGDKKQTERSVEKNLTRRTDEFEFVDGEDSKIFEKPAEPDVPLVVKESSTQKQTSQRKRKKAEVSNENVNGDNISGMEVSNDSPAAGQKAAKKRKVESAKSSANDVKVPRGKRLVSENFVRIDISKKKFCRGKRRIKASTYKRQQWKKKTQFNTSSQSSSKATAKCFKCGKEGHWAKECAKKSFRGNPDRGSTFDGKKNEDFRPVHESDADQSCSTFSLEDVPELPRCWPRMPYEPPISSSVVEPLFAPVNGKPSKEAVSEVNNALRSLGYSSFRHGQEETVARTVSGLSTLLVLSTGSGKSLCYQLPAYLCYKKSKHITVVISPLVALMDDQVGNLPYGLKGACYHTNMSKAQRDKVMRDITDGKIAILLLSPEALVAGSSATGHIPVLGCLPPIAFACIDEAHCVSEWSHNFRPNYLRVCKVLREELGVRCFLGLTATATKSTSMSITKHLLIEEGDSVGAIIRGAVMPDNLHLTVSRDEDRDRALVQLLSGPRFEKCISVIIYCTRREETERLSSMLRTCLKNLPPTELEDDKEEEMVTKEKPKRKGAKSKKPKIVSILWDAECYHAGMTPAQRRRVQKRFMSGELRIVVATTAFGMGLDKSDVRAIIHYNMPKSFESFLQEVGRAGRDGLPAHCHVFLDGEAKDLCELRRHTYANSVDIKSVKRLVRKTFKSCDCKQRYLEANSSNVQQKHAGNVKTDSVASLGKSIEDSLVEDTFFDDLKPEDFEDMNEICSQSDLKKNREEPMAVVEDHVSTVGCSDKLDGLQREQIVDDCISDSKSESPLSEGQVSTDQANAMEAGDRVETTRYCNGHHVAFSIDGAVQDLDMPEENIATQLSYLELHPDSIIKLMNPVRSMCTVKCYGGANQMKVLAKKFMPITAVFNHMKRNNLTLTDGKCISFDIVEIADEMGWDLDIVYRELRTIQWNTQFSSNSGDSNIGKSGIIVEFEDLSFHVVSPGDLSDDERDRVCQILSDRIEDQEQTRILQLDALYNTLFRSSHDTYHAVLSHHDPAADKQLRENVEQYFECDPSEMKTLLRKLSPQNIKIHVPECKWDAISRDVRTMLGLHHDVTFNGRALARIFHGINSPCFPAIVWGRDRRFWRRYLDVDFNELRKYITAEIIRYRT